MRVLAVLLFTSLYACGGDSHDDMSVDAGITDATVALTGADLIPQGDAASAPIVAAQKTWTWVPDEDMVCSDGSDTGIGVSPGTSTDKIFFYFEGGGACGDYDSCFVEMFATNGPFAAGDFANRIGELGDGSGSYLDRTLTDNPFADWTLVYVPYCTGDLHAGIVTQNYVSGSNMQMYHHNGHINALRAFDRVATTWPTLDKLVISGSSAGGYGALLNYPDARTRWPSAESYLIDDSGPTLEQAYTSPLLQEWFVSWGLLDWIKGNCAACVNDVSKILPYTADKYPKDRMALLESLQDMVIRTYYTLQPADFQTALEQVATDRIDPLSNFKYFYISGESHTMLGDPTMFSSGSTTLQSFIDAMVTDSSTWTSHMP